MNALKTCSFGVLSAVALFIGLVSVPVGGQSRVDSVDAHVAAARAAAGHEHMAVFDTLCAPPGPGSRDAGSASRRTAPGSAITGSVAHRAGEGLR